MVQSSVPMQCPDEGVENGQGEKWQTLIVLLSSARAPPGSAPPPHAAKLGISHVLLEKTDHLSDTIYKYQKGKHVMATPSQLVLRADVPISRPASARRSSAIWDKQSPEHKVNVRLKPR
jgi:hypothetical protein